jgi:hypothetical protein
MAQGAGLQAWAGPACSRISSLLYEVITGGS